MMYKLDHRFWPFFAESTHWVILNVNYTKTSAGKMLHQYTTWIKYSKYLLCTNKLTAGQLSLLHKT